MSESPKPASPIIPTAFFPCLSATRASSRNPRPIRFHQRCICAPRPWNHRARTQCELSRSVRTRPAESGPLGRRRPNGCVRDAGWRSSHWKQVRDVRDARIRRAWNERSRRRGVVHRGIGDADRRGFAPDAPGGR
jgi:hypothetical protein